MSVHVTASVWDARIGQAGTKLVLLALADHASREGYCFPSMGTIARMCELGETAVKGHVKLLESRGILTRHARYTAAGRQTSNEFTLHLDRLEALKGEGSDSDPSPKAPPGGSDSDPGRGAISDPSGGQIPTPFNHHKEPSLDPKKEPGGLELFPEVVEPGIPPKSCPYSILTIQWNKLCPSLPPVQGVNGQRRVEMGARWKVLPDLQAWITLFKSCEASDFLTGRKPSSDPKHSAWKCDIDFFVSPAGFDKIREGRYNNKTTIQDARRHDNPILAAALQGKTLVGNDQGGGGLVEQDTSGDSSGPSAYEQTFSELGKPKP